MSRTKGFRDLASYPLQTSYDTSIINFGKKKHQLSEELLR